MPKAKMKEKTQLEFLTQAKTTLNVTWDKLAEMVDISPRALKSYRLPLESKGYRGMSKFVRKSVSDIVYSKSGIKL